MNHEEAFASPWAPGRTNVDERQLGACARTARCTWRQRNVFRVRMEAERSASAAIQSSETTASNGGLHRVVVFGGTSGVGLHVVSLLKDLNAVERRYALRVVSRSRESAKAVGLELGEDMEHTAVDITDSGEEAAEKLKSALEEARTVVICVGTTAFPTRRWLDKPPSSTPFGTGFRLLTGDLKVTNSPKDIDANGTLRILDAINPNSTDKIVLLSSIGTRRSSTFPFSILNLFGVLDAKRAAEDALIEAATSKNLSYAIIRPGRLVGGPHTNPGMLQSEQPANMLGVRVEAGDTALGDVSRKTVAQAILATIQAGHLTDNVDYAVVNAPTDKANGNFDWEASFRKVKEPDMVREYVFESVNEEALSKWVRNWASSITTSGALFPPLPLSVRVDFPEEDGTDGPNRDIVYLSFLSVSVTGDISSVGSLTITFIRELETSAGSRSVLKIVRQPRGLAKPLLGENQLLDKFAEDLASVVNES